MEEYFGVVPCTVMSMMSNGLMPSACETDIAGTVAMYGPGLASGKPSAIVDWNNNYGDDPDKAVIFHCSNLPKDIFVDKPSDVIPADDIPVMDYQEIIAGTVGQRQHLRHRRRPRQGRPLHLLPRLHRRPQRQGHRLRGRGRPSPTTRSRPSAATASCTCRDLQKLLTYICENGYEHHVAMNLAEVAAPVHEALTKYLGWATYHHGVQD